MGFASLSPKNAVLETLMLKVKPVGSCCLSDGISAEELSSSGKLVHEGVVGVLLLQLRGFLAICH